MSFTDLVVGIWGFRMQGHNKNFGWPDPFSHQHGSSPEERSYLQTRNAQITEPLGRESHKPSSSLAVCNNPLPSVSSSNPRGPTKGTKEHSSCPIRVLSGHSRVPLRGVLYIYVLLYIYIYICVLNSAAPGTGGLLLPPPGGCKACGAFGWGILSLGLGVSRTCAARPCLTPTQV